MNPTRNYQPPSYEAVVSGNQAAGAGEPPPSYEAAMSGNYQAAGAGEPPPSYEDVMAEDVRSGRSGTRCVQPMSSGATASGAAVMPSLNYQTTERLTRRSVNLTQSFNDLINQERFDELVRRSERFGYRYDGRSHSQFANSIKRYTSASRRPLNRYEQSQLIPLLLQNFQPTPSWHWPNLTTTLHSLTSAGVFTSHTLTGESVKRAQAGLLSTLLAPMTIKCSQRPAARDLDARSIANSLWTMAKLVADGQGWMPHLEEAVTALLPHVNAQKDRFNAQDIANLLWTTAKLVDNGLERTPQLKETVATLLPCVNVHKDQFNAQGIANLLWATAKLVDNGLEQTPELNEAVAALLPCVKAQQANFKPQEIANLLWAMAKLGVSMS